MGSVAAQKLGLIEGKSFNNAYRKLLARLREISGGEMNDLSDRILIDIEPWKSPPGDSPGRVQTRAWPPSPKFARTWAAFWPGKRTTASSNAPATAPGSMQWAAWCKGRRITPWIIWK
jgi:hypothetical protein